MRTAVKTDWKTLPLPSKRSIVELNKTYLAEESNTIRKGLIPKEMEDKWFIYWEENTLYFHRSWTGTCIYIVHFISEDDNLRMISVDKNRDPEVYEETDDSRDMEMVLYLIDILLLHKQTYFPANDAADDKDPLWEWSQVGQAMFGNHPDDEEVV